MGQTSADKAWTVLHAGLADKTFGEGVIAVRVLGVLKNDHKAPELAINALGEVRAVSEALGQMKAISAVPKMAQFGFEQANGYALFAGLGCGAFAVRKDDESRVRAAAAKMLLKDPDPKTGAALVAAASDKSWVVRMAALDSLARHDDPSVIAHIEPALADDKDVVKYTAAGAIIHLSELKTAAVLRLPTR